MSDTFVCGFCDMISDDSYCEETFQHCPDCRVECSTCLADMEYDAADERAVENWKEGRY